MNGMRQFRKFAEYTIKRYSKPKHGEYLDEDERPGVIRVSVSGQAQRVAEDQVPQALVQVLYVACSAPSLHRHPAPRRGDRLSLSYCPYSVRTHIY
jgi:hypothetical protein